MTQKTSYPRCLLGRIMSNESENNSDILDDSRMSDDDIDTVDQFIDVEMDKDN